MAARPPVPPALAAKRGSPCPPSPCLNGGDSGAGSARRISLANPGLLPKVCCWVPGLLVFPGLAVIALTALFWQQAFYVIGAALTIYTFCYSSNLAISCTLGFRKVQEACSVDWHRKLKALQAESPETSDIMHIVFLPNYKEDEEMMRHTLEKLSKSPLARENMYIVLAMEEREGHTAVREKAANLIDSTRHLFADVFATFHADLPGDVKGKSSNCQWAYKQQVLRLSPQLKNYDVSQIFITCCDADTLFHPQYFSALSYQALQLTCHERAWSIWQPPVFLLRNLFSSPGPTRLSGYATLLFELGGLTNQRFSPHLSFSTYSFTFALASHHLVDGWDRDVIAEDHHMWCKCYFASIWDQLSMKSSKGPGTADVKSMLTLSPVYLPAVSYLVQSDDGWIASIKARFVQARRHSQGLAELSYVILQYVSLLKSERAGFLSPRMHLKTLGVVGKMVAVHIIASLHSLAVIAGVLVVASGVLQWMLTVGVSDVVQSVATRSFDRLLSFQSWEGMQWAVLTLFGPLPLMGWIMQAATFTIVKETLEGKVTSNPGVPRNIGAEEPVAPDVQGCSIGPSGLGRWKSLQLMLMVSADYFGGALITMVIYGLIPALLASWSLLFKNGLGFNYVVGLKPKEA